MPTIYDLKPAFQRLLRPAVDGLARIGVTANQVTVAAFLLCAATGFAALAWHRSTWVLWLYPPVLLVRMALNAVDGQLARLHGQASPLGAFLNELGDVASDAVLYVPLLGPLIAILTPGPPVLLALLLLLAVVLLGALTEMAGVCAVQVGASRRYDGPLGKSDRAFAFGLLAVALAVGLDRDGWVNGYLALLALLAGWTVVNRVRGALAELEGRRGGGPAGQGTRPGGPGETPSRLPTATAPRESNR